MSLFNKIQASAKKRRTKECTIFDEKVLCILHSPAGLRELQKQFVAASEKDDIETHKIVVQQFLDPSTKEPFLTPEFLDEECSQIDNGELINIFMRMNGSHDRAVEQAEKN